MEPEKLRKAIKILQNQSVKGLEFTLNMCEVFLLLAETPGMCQKDILERLSISPGNIARVIASLGNGTPKKCGLKLITSRQSSYDWRSCQYFITNKGLELVTRLINVS